MRSMRSVCLVGLCLLVLVLLVRASNGSFSAAGQGSPDSLSVVSSSAAGRSLSSVRGSPSLAPTFLNRVLSAYHSPAAGLGQALYDDGVKSGIDPAFALAFFLHESSFGTAGVAVVTHSLGNIRCTAGYICYQGYRWYATWQEGFLDWYRLLTSEYLPRGLTTVETIIPVYAPSSDHNDVEAYIAAVKTAVATWRAGQVWV